MSSIRSLLIDDLHAGYRSKRFRPLDVVDHVLRLGEESLARRLWITRFSREEIRPYAQALEGRDVDDLPLYGVPFVVKDNIDLAGTPTTAACAEFAHVPAQSAAVVQRLLEAGAIPLGKTNLDQFATGLVGTRSPYGVCQNSIDARYISGGSSSGSAVAVALGIASFALGTDTAGSGRVPAAFNNIVGVKPSLGRISNRGVVPACRSLDCVSIFAPTLEDAGRVLAVAEGYDALDPYSKQLRNTGVAPGRIGVPRRSQLEFFGDNEYARLFDLAVEHIQALGYSTCEIDFAPFLETARLLYQGPWVAERYAAIEEFMKTRAAAMHPITRQIIEAAESVSAVDAFKAQYRLMALKRESQEAWKNVDVIVTPTAGTIFAISEVEAQPFALNSQLGYYTNFVNLLDLAAVAIPAGFRRDGLPFGVTLIGQASTDRALLRLGSRFHRAFCDTIGACGQQLPPAPAMPESEAASDVVALAVCGAHMEGLPLNHQLRDIGAHLLQRTRTASCYRLYALPGGPPHRPGLVRIPGSGAAIEVEVWAVHPQRLGAFVRRIDAPLGIGKIELEDGSRVSGFLCESHALDAASDITNFGGWRRYLTSL